MCGWGFLQRFYHEQQRLEYAEIDACCMFWNPLTRAVQAKRKRRTMAEFDAVRKNALHIGRVQSTTEHTWLMSKTDAQLAAEMELAMALSSVQVLVQNLSRIQQQTKVAPASFMIGCKTRLVSGIKQMSTPCPL